MCERPPLVYAAAARAAAAVAAPRQPANEPEKKHSPQEGKKRELTRRSKGGQLVASTMTRHILQGTDHGPCLGDGEGLGVIIPEGTTPPQNHTCGVQAPCPLMRLYSHPVRRESPGPSMFFLCSFPPRETFLLVFWHPPSRSQSPSGQILTDGLREEQSSS